MGERRDADGQAGGDGRTQGERRRDGWVSRCRRSLAGALDRVATDEPWAPPPATERKLVAIRRHLERDERIRAAESVAVARGGGGPAAVGVTDSQLLVVSGGSVRDVDLDRITSVRATVGTTLGVRLLDARLLAALGYLCSILAFLAVLAVARNPLSPALTMVAMGGAIWYMHVRPHGLDVGGRTLSERLERVAPFSTLTAALRRLDRRLPGGAGPDPVTRWTAGAFAAVPLAATVRFEGASVASVFVFCTVASFAVVGYAIRHSDDFPGLALVRHRYATLDVAVENGPPLSVRTRPDSALREALVARTAGRSAVWSTDALD